MTIYSPALQLTLVGVHPFLSSYVCEENINRCVILLISEGKPLRDEEILQELPVGTTATFYFRDLGAQIAWGTVSTQITTETIITYSSGSQPLLQGPHCQRQYLRGHCSKATHFHTYKKKKKK